MLVVLILVVKSVRLILLKLIWIPIILQTATGKRDHISIFGTDYNTKDGTCVRDYIHVTDLAQAHILAVQYLVNGGKGDIFNLGNGVGFTVKEVIEKAKEVTGKDIKVVEEGRRAGDPAVLIASSDKAKKVLGWCPEYDSLEYNYQYSLEVAFYPS